MKMKTVLTLLLIFTTGGNFAWGKDKEGPKTNVIQHESLEEYLQRMQQQPTAAHAQSAGTLWTDAGRLADVSSDYKARHTGDLITILVVQDVTANSAGSVSSARNFSTSSGISALPAQLKTANFASLFSPTSTSSLAGKGQAATSSSMRTSLAGRWRQCCPTALW